MVKADDCGGGADVSIDSPRETWRSWKADPVGCDPNAEVRGEAPKADGCGACACPKADGFPKEDCGGDEAKADGDCGAVVKAEVGGEVPKAAGGTCGCPKADGCGDCGCPKADDLPPEACEGGEVKADGDCGGGCCGVHDLFAKNPLGFCSGFCCGGPKAEFWPPGVPKAEVDGGPKAEARGWVPKAEWVPNWGCCCAGGWDGAAFPSRVQLLFANPAPPAPDFCSGRLGGGWPKAETPGARKAEP